jgi:serine/threonine-protein kinase
MSPEQALGLDDIDERTDIWSLCVVLYEVVTGKVPFQKPNYNALMHAIINEDPLPTMEAGAGDKALWQIIERGLKKQREDRHQSVTELGEALALWLYEHGIKEDLSGNSIRAVWLDAAMTGNTSAHVRSARPPTDGSGAGRGTASKSPTMRAPDATQAETVQTVAPRAALQRKRWSSLALPALALLLGAGGAWLWLAGQKPVPAQVVAPATQTVTLPPQPVQAAPTPPPIEAKPVEAAPAAPASAAKPASSLGTKAKPRVTARKKGHDFGF